MAGVEELNTDRAARDLEIAREHIANLQILLEEHERESAYLRAAVDRYRTVAELATDVIGAFHVEPDGTLAREWVTDGLDAVTGYDTEERDARGGLMGILHPDDAPQVEAALRELRERGEARVIQTRIIARNAEVRWIEAKAQPVRDATGRVTRLLIAGRDVTESKAAEEALRAAEERARSIVQHLSDIVWVMDAEARVTYVTPSCERILGYPPDALTGRDALELVHPEDMRVVLRDLDEVFRKVNPFSPTPFRVRHAAGHWVELEAVANNMVDHPAIRGIIVTCRDISERRRAEEERRRLEMQVLQVQKLESLGVLAGGIAHDFNNLLMAILGNADLALRDISPANPARGSIDAILTAAVRAADLCRQMLAYSGKGRFIVQPLDINEVVREMTHLLEVSISKKAVLRYDFARGLPAVEADATQLRQIVMNLITNASEAIGEKSGVISVTTGAMRCDRSYLGGAWLDEELPEGLYVYLEVADSGCGMDAETRNRIFDPFFSTKFTGRGLGLAAALGIVRGHKGAIKVYSEPGKGSTFKVLFPAAHGSAEAHPAGADAAPSAWHGSGTVLLVDDEETIRALGQRMLERFGFEVLTAADGREAVEIFREDPERFTCVVLDLTMPHMDGVETFRELRRIRRDVRVVMSSGYNEQEVTQRFAGKGLAGFIQKPYQSAQLAQVLRNAIGG